MVRPLATRSSARASYRRGRTCLALLMGRSVANVDTVDRFKAGDRRVDGDVERLKLPSTMGVVDRCSPPRDPDQVT
jgi:hypothetical protein